MPSNEMSHATAAASPELFQQLGLVTRQLHDNLNQLGLMPKLQQAAEGLPDVRSRLNYVAKRTGDAAEKVLDLVDRARVEQESILVSASRLMVLLGSAQAPGGHGQAVVGEIEAAAARIGNQLTDIMLAQDFHDLTSQVVAKVVALAITLETSLVDLLVHAAPGELAGLHPESTGLAGPVTNSEGRTDVVSSQVEVDDLLASLGF